MEASDDSASSAEAKAPPPTRSEFGGLFIGRRGARVVHLPDFTGSYARALTRPM